MALLDVRNITVQFGGIKPVSELNMVLKEGELLGLIGPNGAGKTTIFNLLTGVYRPTTGKIYFNNQRIDHLKTHRIVAKGMTRTFQNIRLFKEMSVLDNVKVGFNRHMHASTIEDIFGIGRCAKEQEWVEVESFKLLKLFDLEDQAYEKSGNLPYGKQRKLEIARALATQPKVLLLDEPAAGMNPNETQELMETIKRIRELFKITILLIEHDMQLVMQCCERIIVVDYGRVIAEGTPKEIQNNHHVIQAYLGQGVV